MGESQEFTEDEMYEASKDAFQKVSKFDQS